MRVDRCIKMEYATYTSPRKPIVESRSRASPTFCSTYAVVYKSMLTGTTNSAATSRAPPAIRTANIVRMIRCQEGRILTKRKEEKEKPSCISCKAITDHVGKRNEGDRGIEPNFSCSYFTPSIESSHNFFSAEMGATDARIAQRSS
jgi:hypothetical protein